MRRGVVVAIVLSVALAVAVSGCGRVGALRGDSGGGASASPTSAPTASVESTAPSLDDVDALLAAADGALSQSESDLGVGDEAAAKE